MIKKFTETFLLIYVQYKCKILGHKLKLSASVLCWHNSESAGIQVCFSIFMLSNRDYDEVWGIFCSQGQDVRMKWNTAVTKMFDFPQIEGNLNEETHISQAKQTSFTYHQVIASARSAVLKYRTTGCNLITWREDEIYSASPPCERIKLQDQSPVSEDWIYSSQIGLQFLL